MRATFIPCSPSGMAHEYDVVDPRGVEVLHLLHRAADRRRAEVVGTRVLQAAAVRPPHRRAHADMTYAFAIVASSLSA